MPACVELQCTAALLQHQGSAFALDTWQVSPAGKWASEALSATAHVLPTHPLDVLLQPLASAAAARSAALVKAKQIAPPDSRPPPPQLGIRSGQ